MKKQKVALACGMAVLAAANIDPAAAQNLYDEASTISAINLDIGRDFGAGGPLGYEDHLFLRHDSARNAPRADFDSIRPDGPRSAVNGETGARKRPVKRKRTFVPYAGFGIGKIKASMDLSTQGVVLKKDKGFGSKSRVILGLGYEFAPRATLGLEYRALASDDPLFSANIGGGTFDVNAKYTKQYIYMQLRHRV